MSKEYLEALNYVWYHYYTEELDQDEVDEIEKNLNVIQDGLKRLESIENANPSEALRCLEFICKILNEKRIDVKWLFKNDYNTIKQALLKAQFLEEEYNNLMEDKDNLESELFKVTAPKQYLKWEDLEFDEDGQETLVLLNGTKYRMYYYKGYDECINLFTEDETSVIHMFEGCYSQDKQFFNDLRLERVEE